MSEAPTPARRRIALLGPLHPWRGGLAQYLQLLGEALEARAEVRAVTFTRQYPDFLFPGTSQFDEAAPRPRFPTESMLDSIGPGSWRRVAAHLERFAPAAVVLTVVAVVVVAGSSAVVVPVRSAAPAESSPEQAGPATSRTPIASSACRRRRRAGRGSIVATVAPDR